MSESPQHYQVLARKYRPRSFEDMIGQDAMVTTLTNAFKAGRVAHAFMLTGVRGIGKTTTARLLAKALNYESESLQGPSTDLGTPGIHCERIMTSAHMDVMEMDAASRTGVDNMREMLDGVRYAPVEARYKVYIIDEVHMLSTGAFNALLKTLEEPPDHAKFIFATTEIRKVPITVLSRCQRFDLRRVAVPALVKHLTHICSAENVRVSNDGLGLIARAAEGSVRDSLSLLDQAIVQADLGGEVTLEQIRIMLGLADRVRVLDLFEHAIKGDTPAALSEMRAQYDDGAAPEVVMRDLLDICHEISRAKTIGEAAEFDAAPDQIDRIHTLATELTLGQLTRAWQMLLKSYGDVRIAPVPLAAAEMALLAICAAGQMPPPELAAQLIAQLQKHGLSGDANRVSAPASAEPSASAPSSGKTLASMTTSPRAQNPVQTQAIPTATPVSQPAPALENLDDLIAVIKDVSLASDIRRFVRPIRFRRGAITFQPADGAPVSLTGRIVSAIKDITNELWVISPETAGGGETVNEREKRKKSEQEAADNANPIFNHPLLKSAQLLDIKTITPTLETGNIIAADFTQPKDDDDTS